VAETDFDQHVYAVIMAGGGGTRLWPISRKKHPKHILPLLGEDTLFQSTLKRLEGLVPAGRTLVVTTAEQAEQLMAQAPELPRVNFLLEPQPRGTASVVGLAAAVIARRDPQAIMLSLPSDHFIRKVDLFQLVMRAAVQVAGKGYLVTLGIQPTFPSTGYGYIQQGRPLADAGPYPAYHVLRFTEKPEEQKARVMIATGEHSWNSGMFIWKVENILNEFARQMPALSAALEKIVAEWDTPRQEALLASEWLSLSTVTIDYGIMEHAGNVAVLPAGGLEWSDVGSWDSLYDILLPDGDGNVVINSEHLPLDTHNTLVYSTRKKLVVTIGVDDVILIDSGDALLVCRRDQAQRVRQVMEILKQSKKESYL
jgi:mannose-1-phosphate guanylyltransferase